MDFIDYLYRNIIHFLSNRTNRINDRYDGFHRVERIFGGCSIHHFLWDCLSVLTTNVFNQNNYTTNKRQTK